VSIRPTTLEDKVTAVSLKAVVQLPSKAAPHLRKANPSAIKTTINPVKTTIYSIRINTRIK
jgi:hypothetical protein